MTGLDERSHGAMEQPDVQRPQTHKEALGDADASTQEWVSRLADVSAEALSGLSVVYLLSTDARNLRPGAWRHGAAGAPALLQAQLARQTSTADA